MFSLYFLSLFASRKTFYRFSNYLCYLQYIYLSGQRRQEALFVSCIDNRQVHLPQQLLTKAITINLNIRHPGAPTNPGTNVAILLTTELLLESVLIDSAVSGTD